MWGCQSCEMEVGVGVSVLRDRSGCGGVSIARWRWVWGCQYCEIGVGVGVSVLQDRGGCGSVSIARWGWVWGCQYCIMKVGCQYSVAGNSAVKLVFSSKTSIILTCSNKSHKIMFMLAFLLPPLFFLHYKLNYYR